MTGPLAALALAAFSVVLPDFGPIPEPRPQRHAQSETLHAAPIAPGACALRLKIAGAVFAARPPVSEALGCAIAEPVEISALPGGLAVTPPALMECAAAETLAAFSSGPLQAIARRELGQPVSELHQDSAYVCRSRNGGTKLSEHAFGRAIDIAAFGLASGNHVKVEAKPDSTEARFLDGVRRAACGPFSTVLGPGSDADHASHFHFDLAPRKGAPFCQ